MNNSASMQQVMNHGFAHYAQTHTLSSQQAKVCINISQCRTEVLGGEVLRCQQCETEQTHYHSCRNRHCPKCQKKASQAWCEAQRKQLIPANYYHLVFTLPHDLNGWAQLHPQEIYQMLFQSAWQTLKCFGEDPKRLGGELGTSAILHTWGQNLSQHIHLHCLVPGGAWNSKTQSWHAAKSNYLFPVRALSRCFRGKMISALRQAYEANKLPRIERDFSITLDKLMQQEWVIFSKAYLQRPDTIINYLGRYTHKIAIDDSRILSENAGMVDFAYKDYRDGDRRKHMQLQHDEFIRRFLLHILPSGFMRIRHYGFLANCCRQKKLPQIIEGIEGAPEKAMSTSKTTSGRKVAPTELTENLPCYCPKCKTGQLNVIKTIPPKR